MKYASILIFILFLSVVAVPVASAHILQTSSSIGAVLHVEPSDEPKTGTPSVFFFDITDREHVFLFAECDCKAELYQENDLIFSTALSQPFFSYTFSSPGAYAVRLQPFALTYNIYVQKGTASPAGFFGKHFPHVALVVGLFIGMLLFQVFLSKKQKQTILKPK
jgi:hypothetical protein